jgi:hypothetical protein
MSNPYNANNAIVAADMPIPAPPAPRGRQPARPNFMAESASHADDIVARNQNNKWIDDYGPLPEPKFSVGNAPFDIPAYTGWEQSPEEGRAWLAEQQERENNTAMDRAHELFPPEPGAAAHLRSPTVSPPAAITTPAPAATAPAPAIPHGGTPLYAPPASFGEAYGRFAQQSAPALWSSGVMAAGVGGMDNINAHSSRRDAMNKARYDADAADVKRGQDLTDSETENQRKVAAAALKHQQEEDKQIADAALAAQAGGQTMYKNGVRNNSHNYGDMVTNARAYSGSYNWKPSQPNPYMGVRIGNDRENDAYRALDRTTTDLNNNIGKTARLQLDLNKADVWEKPTLRDAIKDATKTAINSVGMLVTGVEGTYAGTQTAETHKPEISKHIQAISKNAYGTMTADDIIKLDPRLNSYKEAVQAGLAEAKAEEAANEARRAEARRLAKEREENSLWNKTGRAVKGVVNRVVSGSGEKASAPQQKQSDSIRITNAQMDALVANNKFSTDDIVKGLEAKGIDPAQIKEIIKRRNGK